MCFVVCSEQMKNFVFSERNTSSPADVAMAARDFLLALKKSTNDKTATIVGFSGELGAGKTTFTQAVARELGVAETVTSPTFVIEKIYEIPKSVKSNFKHLIHIDAYRLESSQELVKLGFAEIIANPANLVLIEWPERLGDVLHTTTIRLHFSHINETIRKIH